MSRDSRPDASTAAVQSARTALFVPGDRPDRFAKAAASGADLVVCDLEDAVAADRKRAALDAVVTWLTDAGRGCVRLNGTDSAEHPAELAALTGAPGLVSVLVPKAEDPAELERVHLRLGVSVVALLETAVGLSRLPDVASARGVVRLGFGHLDYSEDIGSASSPEAMLTARSSVVLASRVARIAGPFDGVTPQIGDDEQLAADTAHARDLGFTGKLVIHPRQVPTAMAVFEPSPEQVDWARRVIRASAAAGAVQVDGEMVDAPVVARAERVLRSATP